MRTFLALLAGLSVTAFASQTLAQDSPQRDAAIAKCIGEAHKQYPGESLDNQNNRTSVYKTCMTREGQRP
jgi:hypothetical protein